MNKVEISGNIGQAIEVKELDGGKKVCNFSIAHNNEKSKGAAPEWFNVTTWNDAAEAMTKFNKGTFVKVSGKLVQDSYDDKEGNKKTAVKIVAFEVSELVKKEEATAEAQA